MAIFLKGRKTKSSKNDYFVVTGATSKPYVPTPYSMVRMHNMRFSLGEIRGWNPDMDFASWANSTMRYETAIGKNATLALNRAINSYRNKLDNNNGFIETWVERQKSIDMATDAATFLKRKLKQVVRDARLVRKKPWLAAKVLKKYKKEMRHQMLHKDGLADIPMMYLAYNFGIAPTISTIMDTATLLSQPFPPFIIRGGAKIDHSSSNFAKNASKTHYFGGNIYAKVQSTCWGVNSNVYLGQQLGIFTPSVAWELVPWSWLIDYGTNVGDWLANVDPQPPGLKLRDSFHVVHIKLNTLIWTAQSQSRYDKGKSASVLTGQYVSTTRSLGIPNVVLEMPSLSDLSVKQFALAMSALSLTFKDSSFLNKSIGGKRK